MSMMTSNYTTVIEETESFIIDVGNLLRERKTDLSRVRKEKQIADKIIADCCTRIRDILNNLEEKSIDELNENASTKIQIIESHIEYLEITREKAGGILKRMKIYDEKNESDLFHHADESRQLANDVKDKMQEIKRMLHREFIHFVINADIENFFKCLVSLGSVIDNQIKTTTECPDINTATVETTNCHKATIKCSDIDKVTSESSTGHIATTECSDINIATVKSPDSYIAVTKCSDSNGAINESIEHLVTSTEHSQLDYSVFCSSPLQSEVSTMSSLADYENVTYKMKSNPTTRNDGSDTYDSLPCHKNTFQNVDHLSLETKPTNSDEFVSDICETVPVLSNERFKPCSSGTSNTKNSFGNEDWNINDSYTELGINHQAVDCELANTDTETSLSVPMSTSLSSSTSKYCDINKWYKPVPMMRFNVKEKYDNHECNIFDLCLCPDGKLLLIDDNNHKLKRFDQSYKLRDSLDMSGGPYCVCTAGPKMAAVSLRTSRNIQFVHVGKKMSFAKSFVTRHFCRGIAYIDGYLNVCTGNINDPYSGRIEVYNNSGKLLKCIPSEYTRLPSVIKYIAVNEVGQHRFVTMFSNDSVTSLSVTGTSEMSFRHENLKQPEGICTNGKGDLFVCGFHSNNIFRISPHNEKIEEILNEADGIKKPVAIHYDCIQSRLIVSCYHLNEVLIFTVKEK